MGIDLALAFLSLTKAVFCGLFGVGLDHASSTGTSAERAVITDGIR